MSLPVLQAEGLPHEDAALFAAAASILPIMERAPER